VIVPRGSLLGEEVEALRRRLGEALIAEASHVVVDLRRVRYASGRALGVLVAHLGELRQRGGDLKLLGCRPAVRELFDLCGLGGLFEFLAADTDELFDLCGLGGLFEFLAADTDVAASFGSVPLGAASGEGALR